MWTPAAPPSCQKPMPSPQRVAKLFVITQCVTRPFADRHAMPAPPLAVFGLLPVPRANITALRMMQFVTVPPFASMRTLPPFRSA